MRRAAVALWGLAAVVLGQTPEGGSAPARVEPVAPAVMTYSGRPIALPFQCTDDDITWAGLSCPEEEPCPVYLELTDLEPAGDRLVMAGNLHSAAVTLYSIVLSSEDAGRTWRESQERLRGAGLDHIQLLDFETGWISGQSLSPLAQDPFLLITSDGGRTWRRHNLFGEERVGSIQQFWFTAKNAGELVFDHGAGSDGDRYELYESPNAGETWSLKQTSNRPIQLKHGRAGGNGYRIRADGPSKSFHVERQNAAGGWTTAAAFAVSVGACRSVPQPAPPPPAPPQ